MRIARRFAVALTALSVCLVASVANAVPFTPTNSPNVDGAVVVVYDPGTGNLSVADNGVGITTLELKSAGKLFIPGNINAGIIAPPFDVITTEKLFKLSTGGFNSIDFGPVVPAGISAEALLADMDANGSILPRGGLTDAPGGGPYVYVVPEPSTIALIFCGLLGLLGLRRK